MHCLISIIYIAFLEGENIGIISTLNSTVLQLQPAGFPANVLL